MRGVGWLIAAGVLALTPAVASGDVSQHAKPPDARVVGFAAVYRNSAHLVRARPGGVLRRCDDVRSFSAVVALSNITGGSPYRVTWTRGKKRFHTGRLGRTGTVGASPRRRYFSIRKARAIPRGLYTFRLYIDGSVAASGKVRRACTS
jgi:hypothetical protein